VVSKEPYSQRPTSTIPTKKWQQPARSPCQRCATSHNHPNGSVTHDAGAELLGALAALLASLALGGSASAELQTCTSR
jgi:hypothetical protein